MSEDKQDILLILDLKGLDSLDLTLMPEFQAFVRKLFPDLNQMHMAIRETRKRIINVLETADPEWDPDE